MLVVIPETERREMIAGYPGKIFPIWENPRRKRDGVRARDQCIHTISYSRCEHQTARMVMRFPIKILRNIETRNVGATRDHRQRVHSATDCSFDLALPSNLK